jgi:hypothetical protein
MSQTLDVQTISSRFSWSLLRCGVERSDTSLTLWHLLVFLLAAGNTLHRHSTTTSLLALQA